MSQSKNALQIVFDKVVSAVEEGKRMPPGWASRVLYIGKRGAQNWLTVVNESKYPLRGEDQFELHKNRIAAIRDMVPATIVSLGPGDGIDDIEIVATLKSSSFKPIYIPIDISTELLKLAFLNLSPHVEIPVGVLGDFEEGQDFLFQVLSDYASPPILFCLLGGTIGNLDYGEILFFTRFKKLLGTGNSLLIDVPLAGPSWNPNDEPRLNITTYSEGFKQFLGGAVHRWNSAASEDDVVREFENRVAVSLEKEDQIGAKAITIYDKKDDRLLLKLKRYEWHSLLRCLRDWGFKIKFAKCSISSDQDKFGMGVILLSIK